MRTRVGHIEVNGNTEVLVNTTKMDGLHRSKRRSEFLKSPM